jgi:hypothetical protein
MENLKQNEYKSYFPKFDLWGNPLDEYWEFLKQPKNIGNIICAYSDIIKETMPLTTKQKIVGSLVGFFIALIIGGLIYLIFKPSIVWAIIWFVIPITIALLFMNEMNKFKHTNLFIGDNGFAEYQWKKNRDNIIVDNEVSFDDITDVYLYQIEIRTNYTYNGTDYLYVFLNINNGEIFYYQKGTYNKKDSIETLPLKFTFCRKIEQVWTAHLLKNMEKRLAESGYIMFNLFSHDKAIYGPYIKLGHGYITFIRGDKEEFTYFFNEIKRVYSKGTDLYIEHNNFKKRLFRKSSGDKDVIPMLNLCNRSFFYLAMEKLLGYQIT